MSRWLPLQSPHHSIGALLCSGSVPCSSSVPSDSCGQSLASSISTSEVSGPSRLSNEHKALLLDYLGIDRDLSSLEPSGLQTSYQKFTAIVNATPKVMSLGRMKSGRPNLMVQLSGFPILSPSLISSLPSLSSINSGGHYFCEHRNILTCETGSMRKKIVFPLKICGR